MLQLGASALEAPAAAAPAAPAFGEPVPLPPPPHALRDDVVYPLTVNAGWHACATVYADARCTNTPAFLTWIADVRRLVPDIVVETVSAGELARRRARRDIQRDEIGTDQETLWRARQLFTECAAMNVSDIHLIVRPDDHKAIVQVRVKGDLTELTHYEMRPEEGEALSRAMYTGLATVKDATYNPLDFQNAQIRGEAFPDTSLSSVRIIRGPAYPVESGGTFVVARLQYGQRSDTADDGMTGLQRLDKSGFTSRQQELMERLVRKPAGIVIVTGPTGSGKTTSLYELMRYQNQLFPELRQITIEDPPEYPMPWALQLSASGDRFQEMVRMTLRMDPDIILVGELRAPGEASAAVQAAMTGHFVWSTMHVTDPYKVFTRLEDLDRVSLGRAQTCDHELIVGMTSQRLVPVLCPHCSRLLDEAPDALPAYAIRALKTWADTSHVRVRGTGCASCQGTRIAGRTAVAEIVLTDAEFMDDVLNKGILVARRNHRRKEGADQSMLANAIDLILAGKVDPSDVDRGVHDLISREEAE